LSKNVELRVGFWYNDLRLREIYVMRIDGYKKMRAGENKSGIIPVFNDRCHNLIFFNQTKFERRKK